MASGSAQAFKPSGTASIAATTSTGNVVLSGGGDTVLVTNPGTTLAFVRFDSQSNVAAAVTDTPVLPGAKLLLGINGLIKYAAAIMATGSATIYFTRGDGSAI